jgi:L-asparagine oxygenase
MENFNNQMAKNGYAFFPAYHPKKAGEQIAGSFGKLLNLGNGDSIHQLIPNACESATPNTYSGIYGLGRFPFHTDLAHWRNPPHYIMLRCVIGFEEVPTLLANGFRLVDKVGPRLLARALVQPRRPINGRLPLLRIYQPRDTAPVLRWDEVFFRPVSRIGEAGVTLFREALGTCTPTRIALAIPGDTLVIDNWRILHARSPIPTGCEARTLQRAYLERLN